MKKDVKSYLSVLFDPGEFGCKGSMYETAVTDIFEIDKEAPFICINPLDSRLDHSDSKKLGGVARRADMNVTKFRNFLFEIDTLSLEDQKVLLDTCQIPWSAVVYSGSKSYHAILSLEESLPLVPHSQSSVDEYKVVWRRLCAYIQEHARRMGFENSDTVIDPSCKNPSRFTRYPDNIRKGSGNVQSIENLGSRISNEDFYKLLDRCPNIEVSERENLDVVDCYTREEFFTNAPVFLRRKIKYAPFADSNGMYPHIYQLTLWAIDSTNVPKHVLMEILEDLTFPRIVERGGYDNTLKHLQLAVEHAYRIKGY